MNAKFDYSEFPAGYYHEVLNHGSPVRRAWHLQKFKRVIDCLPTGEGMSLLDIGCFAGTFLSLIDEQRFSRQLGVDVLPTQIQYAAEHFGSARRSFRHIPSLEALPSSRERFDVITLIEVIEHLEAPDVACVLAASAELLNPGGTLIVTTPNYTSTWPLLELIVNRVSEVSYEEQHITKFNYFNVLPKLKRLAPGFFDDFSVNFKTTTHLISPFLAQVSPRLAEFSSEVLRHETWGFFPFGNLILLSLRRNANESAQASQPRRSDLPQSARVDTSANTEPGE
jgi:2-polyprenyl-3-methyl-5-hydroxy-6-metoxy-1,4-benzoquinol methylase